MIVVIGGWGLRDEPRTHPERTPFKENIVISNRQLRRAAASSEASGDAQAAAADGPQTWREALLRLSPDRDPCPGFRPNAWARVHANALDFIERHGDEVHGLGWTVAELFGVHPVVGVIRVDFTGALLLTVAGRVVAVEASAIRYANGLTFHRSFGPGASVPVWNFDLAKLPPCRNFGRADAIGCDVERTAP